MQAQDAVFWSIARPPLPPPAALPASADVAIIGGGITGLSVAHALGRRGVRAAVLEAQAPGWGASSRNGGMVLTGLKLDAATLVQRYGVDRARELFAASVAAIDYVEHVVRSERIACDFTRSGHLVVAAKPAHVAGLRHEAEVLQRAFGHRTRLLNAFQLADEIGSPVYHGGLVDPLSAAVQPAAYTAGLAMAADRVGARLCSGVQVQRVVRRSGGFMLQTSAGDLLADQVVVASGGYTGGATPRLRRKVFPLGSYIIVTDPLPDDLARRLIPHGRMIFDTRHLLAYYRLTPDRRMLFGGRAAFFPEGPATVRASAAILQRSMLRVFPMLRDVPVAYAWGGTLDAAFDLMPHAGVDRGVHYALGYAGHGVALASYMGALLAAQVCGEQPQNPFAAIPFPGAPLGLYAGQPWFLPFAGLWYRWQDLIG